MFDRAKLQKKIERIAGLPVAHLDQCDHYFDVPQGRLKLRREQPDKVQLIYYERADQPGSKLSQYHIVPVPDADQMRSVLRAAFGPAIIVEKSRTLYMIGQTRVHLDTVTDLGDFLELEVVLEPAQTVAIGHEIARQIIQQLEICERDFLSPGYLELALDAGRIAFRA